MPADNCDLMDVAFLFQPGVTGPAVGMHHAARLDALLHERQQALARGILDSLHANPADTPPILLSGHCDQCFVFQVSAPQTFFEPAPVAFIDFHCPGQQIPSRPHHRAPHFVQPRPSRFVPVEPQHSLQSQSAGSGLLGGDPPHRTKPQRQRAARVLKDGPRGHRGLAPTRSALQQHFSQRPRLSTTATRTAETVRPAQPEQILPAGLLTAKTGLELCQVLRVIFHLQAYYILGLPESTGYPSIIGSDSTAIARSRCGRRTAPTAAP